MELFPRIALHLEVSVGVHLGSLMGLISLIVFLLSKSSLYRGGRGVSGGSIDVCGWLLSWGRWCHSVQCPWLDQVMLVGEAHPLSFPLPGFAPGVSLHHCTLSAFSMSLFCARPLGWPGHINEQYELTWQTAGSSLVLWLLPWQIELHVQQLLGEKSLQDFPVLLTKQNANK